MPSALSTDLYELTMAAGYFAAGVDDVASFELYVRDLPPNRSYLVAAGLEQALRFLESVRFTDDEIAYLRRTPNLRGVPEEFFDRFLATFRFSGDVCAVEEGTPIFPHEPLLRVTGSILQAQIVETALLAIVTFQTSVASKAARVVEAAAGRPVIEFGSRRAHGPDAAMHAARAAYLAGCDGYVERRGRLPVRRSDLRDDGPLVGDGLRGRDRGVQAICDPLRRAGRAAASTPTTRSKPRGRSWPRGCGHRPSGSTAATS